jgi:formate hydrogenlyase subunit 6/NADH:ubiquinone oxidoreductase subunit I
MSYVRRVLGGFASLITGLGITVKEMFKKPVTYKYPHADTPLSPNYRSAIKLILFEETNSHDCVACLACERICPSFCIKIEGGKVENIKKKRASSFQMDFALCSLCGLCIDACPTATLEYSKLYDEAGYTRDWNMDLLKEFRDYEPQFVDEQRAREEKEAEEKKQKAAAAKAAKAAKSADKPVKATKTGDAGVDAGGDAPAAKAAKQPLSDEEKAARIAAAKAKKAAKAAEITAVADGADEKPAAANEEGSA